MEKFSSVNDFANVLKKGTFGLYVVTHTEVKMNKFPKDLGRKGAANPYMGRAFWRTYYQNAASGCNYYTIVRNECKREGIAFSDDEFKSVFPYEECSCGTSDDNTIYTKGAQQYLRLYKGRKPTQIVHVLECDGRVVAKGSALYDDIMRYVPTKGSESAKQEALGIKNLVGVRSPKIENVVFMGQGDKCYQNPNFPTIDIEELRLMFKK